ncbi:MAG: FitA-like ribbon-helix-helix domain-containing protein [Pseudonocardia sp.]
MPRNVQIRNLDDATYETLRARAAAKDLSLAQYLRRTLEQMADVPSMVDWLAENDRWRARGGGVSRETILAALHESRAERDEQLDDVWTKRDRVDD